MKLSKEDLRFALWYTSRSTSDIFGQAADRLDNGGTLEIEGYVRADHFADDSKMGWIKFDPNDPKTFPTKEYGRVFLVHFIFNHKHIIEYASFNYGWWTNHNITHWRPLPKPPVETEGKNDQEF